MDVSFKRLKEEESKISHERYLKTGVLFDTKQLDKVVRKSNSIYYNHKTTYDTDIAKQDKFFQKTYPDLSKGYPFHIENMIEEKNKISDGIFKSEYRGEEIIIKNKSLHWRELYIGLMLNELKKSIPNFIYTKGITKNNNFCLEYVPSITLENFIKNSPVDEKLKIFLPYILLQAISSLQYANETMGLVHNDFHTCNILLTFYKNDEENLIMKPTIHYINGKLIYLPSYVMVHIIDFDMSRIEYNGNIETINDNHFPNLLSYQSNDPNYDVIRLLCRAYYITPIYFYETRNYLEKLWKYYSSNTNLKTIHTCLMNNFFVLPEIYPDLKEAKPISGLVELIYNEDTKYPIRK
jgi:hypothetical protein